MASLRQLRIACDTINTAHTAKETTHSWESLCHLMRSQYPKYKSYLCALGPASRALPSDARGLTEDGHRLQSLSILTPRVVFTLLQHERL